LASSLTTVGGVVLPDDHPKVCRGTHGDTSDEWGFINSKNINYFTDCTIVEGGLVIIPETFEGDDYLDTVPMTVEQLNVLRNVQIIEHYLRVYGEVDGFTSLSFLRNLHTIKGHKLRRSGRYNDIALLVQSSSLQSLGLVNLKSIVNGRVVVVNNRNLCFAESIKWRTIAPSVQEILSNNKNMSLCANS